MPTLTQLLWLVFTVDRTLMVKADKGVLQGVQ